MFSLGAEGFSSGLCVLYGALGILTYIAIFDQKNFKFKFLVLDLVPDPHPHPNLHETNEFPKQWFRESTF